VVVHGRSRESAERVLCSIREVGGTGMVILSSLDDRSEVERLAREALATGPIDILVNCAGAAFALSDWFSSDGEKWEQQFQLSTFYVVQLIRRIAPAMQARGWGRILNFSSGSAYKARRLHPDYAAAKLALHSIGGTLSAELGASGVTVNTLVSGVVLTENTQRSIADQGRLHGFNETGTDLEQRVIRDVWRSDIPLQRAGRLEELADAACFLVSERASYITGATLRVDGGSSGIVF
jgi:NAD(P)-dependent dehydrogenase (short-subunit alcohol dehydrogenase family)